MDLAHGKDSTTVEIGQCVAAGGRVCVENWSRPRNARDTVVCPFPNHRSNGSVHLATHVSGYMACDWPNPDSSAQLSS